MSESTVDENPATIEDVLQLLVSAVAQLRREVDAIAQAMDYIFNPPQEGNSEPTDNSGI